MARPWCVGDTVSQFKVESMHQRCLCNVLFILAGLEARRYLDSVNPGNSITRVQYLTSGLQYSEHNEEKSQLLKELPLNSGMAMDLDSSPAQQVKKRMGSGQRALTQYMK